MSLAIHANTPNGRAVYNLNRSSKDDFEVQVNWDQSEVRGGGYGLSFNPEETLEVRGWGTDEEWDIQVGPKGWENSVLVMSPPNGMRGGGQTPPIDEIDFGAPIAKDQTRRVALQVASSLIGVPFLDKMLEQAAPGEAKAEPSGSPTLPESDVKGVALSEEQQSKATAIATELAKKLDVSADEVQVTSFGEKGLNAGNFGFPVEGQPQMSAFTQGVELKLSAGEEKFVFRGENTELGSYGVDAKHEGYWKADERGIFVPGNPFPSFEDDWG